MAQDFAQAFYKSKAWEHTRKAYAASVGWICEDCAQKGLIVPGKVVHHIRPLSPQNIKDPSVTLEWSNLRLVCQDCHNEIHLRGDRRYVVLDNGSVVVKT